MKRKIIIAIFSLLALLSVSCNVVQFNKLNNYQNGIDFALDHYVSQYNAGSIYRSLEHALADQKLSADSTHFVARDLGQLTQAHQDLTMLYNILNPNDEQISPFGEKSSTSMYQDFQVFFEHLLTNHSKFVEGGADEQYIMLSDLDEDLLAGVHTITEITGKVETIQNDSYQNMPNTDHNALKFFIKESNEYYHSQEVQDQIKLIQSLIQTWQ